MAPLLFALALFAQDPASAPPSDGPMATAVPRKQEVAALPIQGGSVSAPTDDYGYVGWCYGVMSAYVELYDRAMPEVTRIERAWPTPSTEENISKVYPAQRDEAKKNIALFARAMQAAEKASPSPIQDDGAAAIRRGRAVWTGATSVPKAQLAQFWMSWSPPAKCEETAKTLEARSLLFGQALTYNVKPAAPAAERPAETPMAAMTVEPPADAASAPVAAPEAAPAPVATSEVKADEAPVAGASMIIARPLPSEDPGVEVGADDATASSPEPTVDAAALSAGAPEPTVPAQAQTEPAPSAIDDLLPVAAPTSDAPAATETPAPVEAAPAPAAPAPTAPVKKRKRGLKDTLTGLRGAQ